MMENLPAASVVVPMLLFFTCILAPFTGAFFSSTTVPVTVLDVCANAPKETDRIINNRMTDFLQDNVVL